jgi:hypothetical protein
MDLHVEVELRDGVLLVTVAGTLAVDAASQVLRQVCDTAAENQVNKILVNGLAVGGELSTIERYRVAVELAAYLHGHQMNTIIAFVGTPPYNGRVRRAGRSESRRNDRSVLDRSSSDGLA